MRGIAFRRAMRSRAATYVQRLILGAVLSASAAACDGVVMMPGAGTGGTGTGEAATGGAGTGGDAAGGTAGSTGGSGGASPRDTYYVEAGQLHDRCGERVVLRGVNHPTLYVDRSGRALPEIAETGANAVRLFWYGNAGISIDEAEPAVNAAVANGMLPILELHDSTCAWNLGSITSYWTSSQAVQFIQRHQANLIINLANETSPPSASEFRARYSALVRQLRSAGVKVPIMIDGGRCGRDFGILLEQGPLLLADDPEHNLIFSAHLWDPMSRAAYADLFGDVVDAQLPFVVGEFAHRQPPGCGASIDYAALIDEANTRGIGWLAWSWGNDNANSDWNADCGEFDMTTTFAFSSLRGWGRQVAVDLPDSIRNTAQRPQSLVTGSCR